MGGALLRAVAEAGKEVITRKIRETLVFAVIEGVTISTARHFMDKAWNGKKEPVEEA